MLLLTVIRVFLLIEIDPVFRMLHNETWNIVIKKMFGMHYDAEQFYAENQNVLQYSEFFQWL